MTISSKIMTKSSGKALCKVAVEIKQFKIKTKFDVFFNITQNFFKIFNKKINEKNKQQSKRCLIKTNLSG